MNSENQMEMPLPENKTEYVQHFCKDMLAAKTAAEARGRIYSLTPKSVALQPSLDPRWKVGKCLRCAEVITRKI